MTTTELIDRSKMALSCLPDAEYKMLLSQLHKDLLAEITALKSTVDRLEADAIEGLGTERLKALSDVAALATVGATYPELMDYLQTEIAICEAAGGAPAFTDAANSN